MKLYIVEYQECDFDGKSLWGDEWGWTAYCASEEEAKEVIEKEEAEWAYTRYRIVEKEVGDEDDEEAE